MKSPLNKAALTPKKLSKLLGEQVAYVEYDADGNLTDDIAYAAMNVITITAIEDNQLVGLDPIGWDASWPFGEYGVVPLAPEAWSRRCVVPLSVALQLKKDWADTQREKNGYQATMVPGGYRPREA